MELLIKRLINKVKEIANDITIPIIYQFLDRFNLVLYLHFEKKTPNIVFKQRDIYEINLGQNVGSELNKKRPCIIISNQSFNKGNTVIILPLKGIRETTRIGIITISIDFLKSGLKKPTYCSCFNIREVSKKRIGQYIGTITNENRKIINNSLSIIFGLKKQATP
ncbi:hypothetical protein P148_SR1C00001G1056 [candidate division SR1 bacterium RAAC1_SR1_1]|nr:hypothetical protein P148_SR1C00001G1056 [candidate division SR1 bacterium RAAC1_SR1_1]